MVSIVTSDETQRAVALSVARCPEVETARSHRQHPCHRIVNVQPSDPEDWQVPEGWAGNLLAARIAFVSSNPSISSPEEGEGAQSAENYPRGTWPDEQVADFVINRFHPDGRWAADDRHRRIDGQLATQKTRFWARIRERAQEILGPTASPDDGYVMTEVVHCKSKKEVGVSEAAALCMERHFDRILELTSAPLLVIVGSKARDRIRTLWPVPERFGVMDDFDVRDNLLRRQVGAQERLLVYIPHPTGMEKRRRFEQLYPGQLDLLRRVAVGEVSVSDVQLPMPGQQ